MAHELNLNVADKPDSQDICFVPNGNYSSVIEKFKPNSSVKGNIKNISGKVIGIHDGIINFTIGQRRGIKVADEKPLYVLEINSDKNEIVVGSKDLLKKNIINLREVNLLTKDKNELKNEIFVKVRSTGKLIRATVEIEKNCGVVNLLEDEYGISPGQACVFYRKDNEGYRVLGGGWIHK